MDRLLVMVLTTLVAVGFALLPGWEARRPVLRIGVPYTLNLAGFLHEFNQWGWARGTDQPGVEVWIWFLMLGLSVAQFVSGRRVWRRLRPHMVNPLGPGAGAPRVGHPGRPAGH